MASSQGPEVQESKGPRRLDPWTPGPLDPWTSGPSDPWTSGPWDPWTLRRRWYATPGRQHRLRRPVVSVGNLSLGGRGKTPLVALVARWLVEAGERPAILSRGYARRESDDGVVVASDGTRLLADVDRCGDEPMMLAHAVPGACVMVSDLRAVAGALAERALGATVHVLDDGFQHLQLARDLDVVIVAEEDLKDRPLPFGRLREPVGALAWADAVVMDGAWSAGPPAPGWFKLSRSLGEAVPLEPERRWDAPDCRVVAIAGIAQPGRFAVSLEAAGWRVVELLSFRDHHLYTSADLARIASAVRRHGVPVVTTEKDAMRLLPLRPLPFDAASVPLVVEVEPAASFRSLLLDRVRKRAAGRNRPAAG